MVLRSHSNLRKKPLIWKRLPNVAHSQRLDWSEKAAVNATDQCSHRIDNAHRIRARSRAKRGSDSASGRTGHCANRHRANRSATAAAAKTGIADAISDNPVALISAFRQQHGEGRSPSAPRSRELRRSKRTLRQHETRSITMCWPRFKPDEPQPLQSGG